MSHRTLSRGGGVGVGLLVIAGGLQIWDVMTTPIEQIERGKGSEDMRQIEGSMRNLQDLVNEEYGNREDDAYCP